MDIISIMLFEIASHSHLEVARVRSAEEIIGRLRESDLRITPQRRSLIEQIVRMPAHFSAEDLLRVLREREVDVSRATLYRLLPTLEHLGVLREVLYGEEHSHYEVVQAPEECHGHLICKRCGQIIDFVCPAVEGAIVGVCQEHHFEHRAHTLEITGLCEQCQAQLHNN